MEKIWRMCTSVYRRELVREATKTTYDSSELQASVADMWQTVHMTTVAQALYQSKLFGRVAKTKKLD